MKVISVVNQKGGVGKTTLVFNLSYLLHDEGLKVLAIDLDPQANLTMSVIGELLEEDKTSYHMLLNGELPIRKTNAFDIIPSSLSLANAELELVSAFAREYRLSKVLSKLKDDKYDVAIVDTPPNLGILTLNALMASDSILIPSETRFYGLAGLKHLLRVLNELKKFANKEVKILGIVPTMFEKSVILHREVLHELKTLPYKNFPPIYKRSAFQYSSLSRKPAYKEHLDKETFNGLKAISEEVKTWLKEKEE